MKIFGEALMVLAGFGFVVGIGLIALANRNMNDLFVWAALGMLACGGSLVLCLIGWVLSRSGSAESTENHKFHCER